MTIQIIIETFITAAHRAKRRAPSRGGMPHDMAIAAETEKRPASIVVLMWAVFGSRAFVFAELNLRQLIIYRRTIADWLCDIFSLRIETTLMS